MNSFRLELFHVQLKKISGITFRNKWFVNLFIDDKIHNDFFEDTIIVFDELLRSVKKSGSYLIFTGISGIADEAGCEFVEVIHTQDFIEWSIRWNDDFVCFKFFKKDYIEAILEADLKLSRYGRSNLEPLNIIFPESNGFSPT